MYKGFIEKNSAESKIDRGECLSARRRISDGREKYFRKLEKELNVAGGDDNSEQDESDVKDISHYKFPFENLVLEGGGVKGVAYVGLLKVLEKHGILQQMNRFAGASAGAIVATALAVGYNSYDMEKILDVDLKDLTFDKFFVFTSVPNLLNGYGINSGDKFEEWMGTLLNLKTGDPDITFGELYDKNKIELCIMVTNVNSMTEEYLHVKTTPDMKIKKAVRMSISLPGLFEVVQHKITDKTDLFVDGGLLCNFPIHCFDGWWLSMDWKDSFLHRMQPISKLQEFLDPENRFRYNAKENKTLGAVVYSSGENQHCRYMLQQTCGVTRGTLPETKLASNWEKTSKGKDTLFDKYKKTSDAVMAFFKVMADHDLDKNTHITKEEFDKAFSEKKFKQEYRILLFGDDCKDFDTIFQALDKNGNGKIVFRELVNYLESTGISLKEMYLGGHTRRQVTGVFSYGWRIAMGMHENTRRIHFKQTDVDRTVGINTWYINTTDFDIKEKDKDFMVDQGERSTLKYLNSYVERHSLPKVSATELRKRKIPTKTTLRPREIKQLLDV